jgi:hypothetical protein
MVLLDMNSGYAGENSSLLPQAAGSIDAVRGGGIIGGGDPKEINLFGTKITITDPSTGALTSEHEKILSKLNFKDKDDAEKRNILQSIYNEGCDTNAALDLKSGCSPMRGLVTALAMKLLENMSASTATATTVGDDEGIVISMTIPIEKLNIALGSMATNDITGNPDTWCVGGEDVIDGMNNLLVMPLTQIRGTLNKLKGEMTENIDKTIKYESNILDNRFTTLFNGIDILLKDIAKIQSTVCESGGNAGNAGSTISGTSWISTTGHGEEGNVANPENVKNINVTQLTTEEEIEEHKQSGAEEGVTESSIEGYEEGEEPAVIVTPAEQARLNKKPATLNVTTYPPSSASDTLPSIPKANEEVNNNNTVSETSGGFYRKKRIIPNKTRRKVRFGDMPIIKLI